MANFKIEVREILARVIEIEADSIEDAVSAVVQQYGEGEIILNYDDFLAVEFNEFSE